MRDAFRSRSTSPSFRSEEERDRLRSQIEAAREAAQSRRDDPLGGFDTPEELARWRVEIETSRGVGVPRIAPLPDDAERSARSTAISRQWDELDEEIKRYKNIERNWLTDAPEGVTWKSIGPVTRAAGTRVKFLESEVEELRKTGERPAPRSGSGRNPHAGMIGTSGSSGSGDWFVDDEDRDSVSNSNFGGSAPSGGIANERGVGSFGGASRGGQETSSFSFGDTSDVGSFGGSGNFSVGGR